MHAPETIEHALRLAHRGESPTVIARRLAIPRATVRDWCAGRVPGDAAVEAREPWRRVGFPVPSYCHLLGLYLGDGHITQEARTARLRVFFDAAYPMLIAEAVNDLRAVRPGGRVRVARRLPTQCVVVEARWTRWSALFPQHGEGAKHGRRIVLHDWQRDLTTVHPKALVRGLLHSDGCRFVNRVRVRGREYAYPSYQFTNRSEDIKAILCEHLDLLGIAWRRAGPRNIAITRRDAVAQLDEFVGPKTGTRGADGAVLYV
jgi:hypothetical protein